MHKVLCGWSEVLWVCLFMLKGAQTVIIILLKLLCFQTLAVVCPNNMHSFKGQLAEAVKKYVHLYDSSRQICKDQMDKNSWMEIEQTGAQRNLSEEKCGVLSMTDLWPNSGYRNGLKTLASRNLCCVGGGVSQELCMNCVSCKL